MNKRIFVFRFKTELFQIGTQKFVLLIQTLIANVFKIFQQSTFEN